MGVDIFIWVISETEKNFRTVFLSTHVQCNRCNHYFKLSHSPKEKFQVECPKCNKILQIKKGFIRDATNMKENNRLITYDGYEVIN